MPSNPPRQNKVTTAALFGRCLAFTRHEAEMSQAQLAILLKVSRAGIAQMESGHSPPSFFTLFRLAHPWNDLCEDFTLPAVLRLFDVAGGRLREQGYLIVNHRVDRGDAARIKLIDDAIRHVWVHGLVPRCRIDAQGEPDAEEVSGAERNTASKA